MKLVTIEVSILALFKSLMVSKLVMNNFAALGVNLVTSRKALSPDSE